VSKVDAAALRWLRQRGMTIQRIQIENLRGIRRGEIEGLSPLSILVGPNNSGKSTALEALYCAGIGIDPGGIYKLLLRRGGPSHHALAHVWFDSSTQARITASGSGEQKSTVILDRPQIRQTEFVQNAIREGLKEPIMPAQSQWDFSWDQGRKLGSSVTHVDRSGAFATNYIEHGIPGKPWVSSFVDVEAVRNREALEDAYSRLEAQRRVVRVVQALRRAMPTLTDLRILRVEGDFILHAICGDLKPIPAYLAGDGFKRFLEVAASVYSVGAGGVVLLEEPESFQHPRYLNELATVLLDAANQGTQVILSTHSLELIDLLLEARDGEATVLPTVHRLRLHENELHAVTISGENARFARDELAQDLRS